SREDVVLQTLLDKLDLIRDRLGSDKVFDLISERYDNVSLSDLIFRATVGGEKDAVVREIASTWTPEQADKMVVERERRIEMSEVRWLLEALKRRRESAEERRMMPAYVRRYFAESAPLIGLTIDGDLNGIFSLVEAPDSVRRALTAYPEELRNKLTFDRE